MKKEHICQHCSRIFTPGPGSIGVTCSRSCRNERNTIIRRAAGEILKDENEKLYLNSPRQCKHCTANLGYSQRYNNFCSHSCSGSYTNENTKLTRKKPLSKIKIREPKPEYSTLYKCICKHCGYEWRNRTIKKYCDEHSDLYSHDGRAQYWFTFSLSSYPDLFDGELLRKYGMRSLSNPNGVTRDHRVSVNEAIRNGYDPYYIKHPLNCELMLFEENNRKKTTSSMTYTELVEKVKEYDKMVGRAGLEPATQEF